MQHLISTIKQKKRHPPATKQPLTTIPPPSTGIISTRRLRFFEVFQQQQGLDGLRTHFARGQGLGVFSNPQLLVRFRKHGVLGLVLRLQFLRSGKWQKYPSIAFGFLDCSFNIYIERIVAKCSSNLRILGDVHVEMVAWLDCQWKGPDKSCTKTSLLCFYLKGKLHACVAHLDISTVTHKRHVRQYLNTNLLAKNRWSLLLHGITWPSGNQLTPTFIHAV